MNNHHYNRSRRRFLKDTIAASALMPLANASVFANYREQAPDELPMYIFSKHLQFLKYDELADAAASMGFKGIDLTVRPNGHVLPERVKEDLPKAVEAMKKHGLEPMIMTANVDEANDPVDRAVLETASALGFRYYRMNWLSYLPGMSMPEAIEKYMKQMKELGELNKKLAITGCYQNHAGDQVGAVLWEVWQILRDADPQYTGSQFDIRHAVVEGGMSWENALKLVASRVKSITVKDFRWAKKNGKWVTEDVPVGEGMIDYKKYFGLVKQLGITAPVTLHIEYDLGGAEHGATSIGIDRKKVFDAMKKDMQTIQQLWREA